MAEKELVQKVIIPEEISAENPDKNTLVLKSPKGMIKRTFKSHRLKISLRGREIILEGTPANKQTRALLHSVVAHIKNMVEGLLYGHKYDLKIVYSHFPLTAEVEGGKVKIKNFTGEKFNRWGKIIGDAKVAVKGQEITVTGLDKESVGQTAANMELATKVRKRDVRRFQDGIYIVKRGNIEEKKKGAAIATEKETEVVKSK
ncbi:MAG: 50S ribosomal protein L6 [Candidatus Diapherotrites archaeon]|nr:50S ribosomal protein L6 [Candidatus Diapherotrites archaeon]